MTVDENGGAEGIVLAFEGGATHTKAAVVRGGVAVAQAEAGPCNPTAYGVAASARALIEAAELALAGYTGPRPAVAAIGSAGAVEDAQKRALGEAVCAHFGLRRAVVSTDLHPLLLANAWDVPGILAIAGTGSNVLARDAAGHLKQVGGRGQLMGDDGSGYMVAAEALRRAARAQDGWGPATTLNQALAEAAGVPEFDALISWGAAASKRDIAALSRAVIACAAAGDAVAMACVAEEAGLLAEQVLAAAGKLGGETAALEYVYGVGGLFERHALFVEAFNARLAKESRLRYAPPRVIGPAAVAVLARLAPVPAWAVEVVQGAAAEGVAVESRGTESTEIAAPLDALDAAGVVRTMLSAEAGVSACLRRCEGALAKLVELAAAALRAGGRIVYFGAGTSGRLGVLDAAECGPTFGAGAESIVARIAGGAGALLEAVEGAEDDTEAGAQDVAGLGIGAKDLVVGIAASGTTPYVRGAVEAARGRGAQTALICCTAGSSIPAELVVALDTGAEALPGSTRLKAGTATKIALNVLSTGAFALTGRVFEGRMVAMRPTNVKLHARAARIVAEVGRVEPARAEELLREAAGEIRTAIAMARLGLTAEAARGALQAAGGDLHRVVG